MESINRTLNKAYLVLGDNNGKLTVAAQTFCDQGQAPNRNMIISYKMHNLFESFNFGCLIQRRYSTCFSEGCLNLLHVIEEYFLHI